MNGNNKQYDMSSPQKAAQTDPIWRTVANKLQVHRQVPALPLATSLPARCLLLHLPSSQPQGSSHALSRGEVDQHLDTR